jgi:diacylglycerol kinase (ATP)
MATEQANQTQMWVVINPRAASGRAEALWQQARPILEQHFGPLQVVRSAHANQTRETIARAHTEGATHLLSVGGDGTNHNVVNALVRHQDQYPRAAPLIYGNLPIGTGCDWARMNGVPRDPSAAAAWLTRATPRRVDVGVLRAPDNSAQQYFPQHRQRGHQ